MMRSEDASEHIQTRTARLTGCLAATMVMIVVALGGCESASDSGSNGSKVIYGVHGISVLVRVDDSDPSRVVINGRMRYEADRPIHLFKEPGGVLVVGTENGWSDGATHFEYRHILLTDAKRDMVLAEPGTVIRLAKPNTILGYALPAGEFIVPADSKIPMKR
jgi:hypothetical protein